MKELRRLIDIGERAIISQVLNKRYASEEKPSFGNDCAYLGHTNDFPNRILIATTDPCPEPMAAILGFNDLYYRGWLLVTINLSDLGATGARPLGLLTSLVLPNTMPIESFMRLLDGIDDCCKRCGTQVVGGNLKEGKTIDMSATAIGVCDEGKSLTRKGCRSGDLIVVIGDLGLFWAGVLAKKENIKISKKQKSHLLRNILTPLPKVKIGYEIAKRSLLTCSIDNSDGLYPSLLQLAEINNSDFHIDMSTITFSEDVLYVSSKLDLDPVRLSMGWGDWQLIGCIDPLRLDELRALCNDNEVELHSIGVVKDGNGVTMEHRGKNGSMFPLDSQRFSNDSWFTAGIDSYIEIMLANPIVVN
jgi:thiamine-monophosphate kinase